MITLSNPAPRRCWSPSTQPGKWYSHPWREEDVQECLQGGGWFMDGLHDFASTLASKLAFGRQVPRETQAAFAAAKVVKQASITDEELDALYSDVIAEWRKETL